MANRSHDPLKSDLNPHWFVVAVTLILLTAYLFICQNLPENFAKALPEAERVPIRTLCYGIAIVLLPLTNLIRHIQLRLNQTMPGDKPANKRYLLTIIVSMTMVQNIGVLAILMFSLGDDYNTVYIMLGMAALGVFLYRPKDDEYQSILAALHYQE